jgi:hypothetical protein
MVYVLKFQECFSFNALCSACGEWQKGINLTDICALYAMIVSSVDSCGVVELLFQSP